MKRSEFLKSIGLLTLAPIGFLRGTAKKEDKEALLQAYKLHSEFIESHSILFRRYMKLVQENHSLREKNGH